MNIYATIALCYVGHVFQRVFSDLFVFFFRKIESVEKVQVIFPLFVELSSYRTDMSLRAWPENILDIFMCHGWTVCPRYQRVNYLIRMICVIAPLIYYTCRWGNHWISVRIKIPYFIFTPSICGNGVSIQDVY